MTMNVVRIAKLVALLAFVLPWVAVSCSGMDLATASGIDLIQGELKTNTEVQQQMSAQFGGLSGGMGNVSINDRFASRSSDLGMNYFAVGAGAVIVIGLLLSFVGGARSAARNTLVTSLLAACLAFGATWQFKEQIKAEGGKNAEARASADPFGDSMGMGMGGNMIDNMIQYRVGFWLVLGALVVAAGASGSAMSGRQSASAEARPDSM